MMMLPPATASAIAVDVTHMFEVSVMKAIETAEKNTLT